MDTEASRQLVLDYYEALGDPARLAQVLADDVEWTTPATAPVPGAHGRDAVLKMMGEAGGRFFDMTTNGRDYSNEYVWVFKCADGRIVRMEEHLDTACFQQIVLNP